MIKLQVLVWLIQTGSIGDQKFEFLLNNFARLTNFTSKECSAFVLCKSVLRLQLLHVVFKLRALKVKGLENFRAFGFCLKLRVNGGMLRFSIALITVWVLITEITDNSLYSKRGQRVLEMRLWKQQLGYMAPEHDRGTSKRSNNIVSHGGMEKLSTWKNYQGIKSIW